MDALDIDRRVERLELEMSEITAQLKRMAERLEPTVLGLKEWPVSQWPYADAGVTVTPDSEAVGPLLDYPDEDE